MADVALRLNRPHMLYAESSRDLDDPLNKCFNKPTASNADTPSLRDALLSGEDTCRVALDRPSGIRIVAEVDGQKRPIPE